MDANFNGRDPFNQTSDWSDWEKWFTWKVEQFFRNIFQLDRADPLGFAPKFPEILIEWITPKTLSHSQGYFTINPQREKAKKWDFKNDKQ